MSQTDFEAKLEELSAIPDSEVQTPNMPVATAVQESEDLAHWAQEDKETLTQAGLDPAILEDLQARTGACRYAQSVWMKEYQSQQEAELEWKEKSPQAFDLRDELVHHFFHAFRDRPDLILRVRAIAEGGSNADMLQDLSDLHVLGNANLPLLQAINMDVNLLGAAEATARELSDVLARANGQRFDGSDAKLLRDKAFTYMKQAVDEIRRHGQYVFWRNEARKKGYVSRYHKAYNTQRRGGEVSASNVG